MIDDIFYHAATLITLLSLFILGPALGRAWMTRIDGSQGWSVPRAGPGCLNRISASISGASAGVRLPDGAAAG